MNQGFSGNDAKVCRRFVCLEFHQDEITLLRRGADSNQCRLRIQRGL